MKDRVKRRETTYMCLFVCVYVIGGKRAKSCNVVGMDGKAVCGDGWMEKL